MRLVFTKLSIQGSSDSAQIVPNMFHDIWINVHKPTSTQYSPISLTSTQHQLTFFNNTQQQHNDMPQNVDIVGQQYIAINIVGKITES